ncbi:MAG: YcxB family protein [Verrucomicrobiota bacterium]
MKASYVLNKSEIRKGAGYHYDYRHRLQWIITFLIGFALLAFGIFFLLEGRVESSAIVLVLIGFYLLLNRVFYKWRAAAAVFKGRPGPLNVEMEIQDDGIFMETEISNGMTKWGGLMDLKIVPDGLLLYPQRNLFYWIPANAEIKGGSWTDFALGLERRYQAAKSQVK